MKNFRFCMAAFWIFTFFASNILLASDAKCKNIDSVAICSLVPKEPLHTLRMKQKLEDLGSKFSSYTILLYENNSSKEMQKFISDWKSENPFVVVVSDRLSIKDCKRKFFMKIPHFAEKIAYGRNRLLQRLGAEDFQKTNYVICMEWDDRSWNEEEIVSCIQNPPKSFDGVFAFDPKDVSAIRTQNFPIGFELLGSAYDDFKTMISENLSQNKFEWFEVFSGYSGLAIYPKSSLLQGVYSSVVTQSLDRQIPKWIALKSNLLEDVMYQKYLKLSHEQEPYITNEPLLFRDDQFPPLLGLQFEGGHMVWFSCIPGSTFAWTFEHVTLHAEMAEKGSGKFFINPKLLNTFD